MLAHCVVSTYDRLPPSAPVLELLDPVLELLDCLTMKRKCLMGHIKSWRPAVTLSLHAPAGRSKNFRLRRFLDDEKRFSYLPLV